LKRIGKYCVEGPGAHTWGNIPDAIPDTKSLGIQFVNLLRSIFWSRRKYNPDIPHLIVPRRGHKVDGLTLWVANEFVPFWQSLKNFCRKSKSKFMKRTNKNDEEKQIGQPKIGAEDSEEKNGGNTSASPSLRTNRWRMWKLSKTWKSKESNPESESDESKGPKRNSLNKYSHHRILLFTSSVATVLACLLPTVAIAVLSSLKSTGELLGVIAAFTAIFAIGLMALTDASTSRVEIFTATAAFSAVMVVFVQNQNVYISGYSNGSSVKTDTISTNG